VHLRTWNSIAITCVAFAFASVQTPAQSTQYVSPAGVTYRSQPDTGAIARAEQALAAAPNNVDRLIDLGIAQSGVRQFREAIATFTRGIEIAPRNAILYRWRGHRYLSVREFDRALADLNKGASIDSSVYGIWYHLGVLRFVQGDFKGAADAFARGRPIAPNAGERAGSYDWGWMSLMRAGRADEARALLASMPDSVPPAAANAYSQRLRLYKGEITPEQVLTPADTGDVNVATLAYGLGNWYLLKGDRAKAREWFERSIKSGGWPAFGFIASEAELRRLR
jgi:tetratricopeptide (TPR) repeat protein